MNESNEGEPKLTLIYDSISIMEVNAMIRVREKVHIVVLHICKVQLIQQTQSILEMHIIISNTMHDQKPDILGK